MYAVIKTGGKQYKVALGHVLRIEKLDAKAGANMDFHDVLMVANGDEIRIGAPQVDGGKVTATVLEQGRRKKVKIIKFKRRKHHLKRMGHRQSYTEVKITGIMAEGIEATLPIPDVAAKNAETTPSETDEETQNVEAAVLESVIDSQKAGVTLPSSEAETQKSEEVKPHGT